MGRRAFAFTLSSHFRERSEWKQILQQQVGFKKEAVAVTQFNKSAVTLYNLICSA